MINTSHKVYVIAGPTAVGKTAIAIALAKRLHTAIVSADSRQCYKEMSIGTAKPGVAEQEGVKHYFVDEYPMARDLTAADYEKLSLCYLDEIFINNDSAVVCGGTGLYIKALCDGLDSMPATDPAIVAATEENYKQNGLEWLQQAVQKEDAAFFAIGEIDNPARLLRALSFVRSTGESIVKYRTETKKERPFQIIKVGLELPREELYSRINHRVDVMMEQGLPVEAEHLYPYRELKNLQTVGYTELFDHIAGKCTLSEAVAKMKQHTRNYAKRQLTWFKKDKGINWLSADDPDVVEKIISLGY